MTLFSNMLNKRIEDDFEGVNKRFDEMRDLWQAERGVGKKVSTHGSRASGSASYLR